jgi:protein O-GlcNAc transferase
MSSSRFDPLLRQALGMQQMGRIEDAARVFREILRQAPGHPIAMQFLGVLYAQRGETGSALALFERAAMVESGNPISHYSRKAARARHCSIRSDTRATWNPPAS